MVGVFVSYLYESIISVIEWVFTILVIFRLRFAQDDMFHFVDFTDFR